MIACECYLHPEYYRWTQWIFINYIKRFSWQKLKLTGGRPRTVLANEEVINVDGKMVSERGNHQLKNDRYGY